MQAVLSVCCFPAALTVVRGDSCLQTALLHAGLPAFLGDPDAQRAPPSEPGPIAGDARPDGALKKRLFSAMCLVLSVVTKFTTTEQQVEVNVRAAAVAALAGALLRALPERAPHLLDALTAPLPLEPVLGRGPQQSVLERVREYPRAAARARAAAAAGAAVEAFAVANEALFGATLTDQTRRLLVSEALDETIGVAAEAEADVKKEDAAAEARAPFAVGDAGSGVKVVVQMGGGGAMQQTLEHMREAAAAIAAEEGISEAEAMERCFEAAAEEGSVEMVRMTLTDAMEAALKDESGDEDELAELRECAPVSDRHRSCSVLTGSVPSTASSFASHGLWLRLARRQCARPT